MKTIQDPQYRLAQALGKHLFLLGAGLLTVILAGLAAPAIVIILALRESQPWWIATGATLFTLAGVAAVLHAIPPILGPEGVTGIVRELKQSHSQVAKTTNTPGDEAVPPEENGLPSQERDDRSVDFGHGLTREHAS